MAKELNEQQKVFLEVLFSEGVDGDVLKAKKLAGYSDNYATSVLLKGIEEEILLATRGYLARLGPLAAHSLGRVFNNPTEMGVGNKIKVATDILDRIGITKTEKVEVQGNGIFILPRKDDPHNA
jgi:hypothetical protein